VTPAPASSDSFATPRPTLRPELPEPFVDGLEFHYADDAETLRADYEAGRIDAVSGVGSEDAATLAEADETFLLRYPGSTLTAVLFNLRPGRAGFMAPEARTAFLQAIDRDALIEEAFDGAAVRAESPIPPSSPLHDPTVTEGVAHDPAEAAAALEAKGWKKVDGLWRLPDRTKPFTVELISPDEASNPAVFAAASAVTRDWQAFGVDVTHVPLPAGEFVNDRIAKADFSVAVADLAIGLDPDLYPLLASTQTLTGGSNIIGLQDPTLDPLLAAARKPGSDRQRQAAYSRLETQLAKGRYLLPLAFADETVVVHERVSGPVVRQVADPSDRFWDVLTWRLADDP
jgi:peptide/nickel transport system substrate-binding protein